MITAKRLGRSRHAIKVCAVLLLAGVGGLASGDARAAGVNWGRQAGAFEGCLDEALDQWLQAQAALLVDESPAAAKLDDAAVARWTVDILGECRMRAGSADAKSEDRFTTHMARWRNHIYDLASSIRQKGLSD